VSLTGWAPSVSDWKREGRGDGLVLLNGQNEMAGPVLLQLGLKA
jgi:hypothetical protein